MVKRCKAAPLVGAVHCKPGSCIMLQFCDHPAALCVLCAAWLHWARSLERPGDCSPWGPS